MLRWFPPANRAALMLPLIMLLALAACATDNTTTTPAAGQPPLAATATARGASEAAPAATSQPAVVAPAGELAYATGRNPDGTYFRGEPDAPVTLIVYSDFL